MPLFSIVQKCMAITLSIGFVAHDYEYTHKLADITLITVICLMAMLYFHALILLKELGYVEIQSADKKKYIYIMRGIISLFAILYCFNDYVYLSTAPLPTQDPIKTLVKDILNSIIVVIPEIVFRIIFAFRQKPNS